MSNNKHTTTDKETIKEEQIEETSADNGRSRQGRDTETREAMSRSTQKRLSMLQQGPLEIPMEYLPEKEKYRYQWLGLNIRHPFHFKQMLDLGFEPVKEDQLHGGTNSVGDQFLTQRGIMSTGGLVIRKESNDVELYLCRIPHEIYKELKAEQVSEAKRVLEGTKEKAYEPGFYGEINHSTKSTL